MTRLRSKSSLFTAALAAAALFLAPAGSALAHHHHHHHHDGSSNDGSNGTNSGDLGPVHGSGSSHNPVVTHPLPSGTVVRDHRDGASHGGDPHNRKCLTVVGGPFSGSCIIPGRSRHHGAWDPHCNKRDTSGCKQVRDHRVPPEPQCYGNLC